MLHKILKYTMVSHTQAGISSKLLLPIERLRKLFSPAEVSVDLDSDTTQNVLKNYQIYFAQTDFSIHINYKHAILWVK